MSDREYEQLCVRECDACMESGRAKVLKGNHREGLDDFLMARDWNRHCAPVLWCCAFLCFMLGDKASASEYKLQANQNGGRCHSDIAEDVYQDFWAEFMNFIISQPLAGSGIHIRLEESLPLPSLFSGLQSNNTGSQHFISDLHFTPTIVRFGDEVEVTLTLKTAEFGVPNFLKSKDVQGFFVHEFEFDASPGEAWKPHCELVTVSPGVGHDALPVQQQVQNSYQTQFGTSGATAGANLTYTYSDAMSTSTFLERMIASKAPDDATVFRCTWKLNMYKDGHAFYAKNGSIHPVWRDHELPFDAKIFACSDSGDFKAQWKVTAEEANKLHYHFDWDITVRAKLALVPRSRKRDKFIPKQLAPATMPHREPLTHSVENFTREMSDFTKTSEDRI